MLMPRERTPHHTLFVAEGRRMGRRKLLFPPGANRQTVAYALIAAYRDEARLQFQCELDIADRTGGQELGGNYVAQMRSLDTPENPEYGTSDHITVRKPLFWERLL